MGANYSRIKTWATTDSFTAADINAEFNNILNNHTPAGMDDYSATNGEMNTTSDPYPGAVQTRETSLAGELGQIRYQLAAILGETYWYIDTDGSMADVFTNTTTFAGKKTFSNNVIFSKGADVASANALPIITDGNYFDVTGTTAITSIDTVGVGAVIKLHFDGILTLTHHATDLILPTGANITTAAGDEAEFVEYATGDWRCTNYSRADGTAVSQQTSPSFSVHKGGTDQTGVVTATWTKVTWPTEEFDTNSDFASNEFIPTVAGKYLLSAHVQFTTMVDTSSVRIAIYKNDVVYKVATNAGSGTVAQGVSITAVVDANGTDDDFEIWVNQATGGDKIIEGAATDTFFTGSRIS